MKKDWDWKKSVVNGVITKRTNINPKKLYPQLH